MSTVMVLAGAWLGWPTRVFAAINVGLALAWLGFVLLIARQHRLRSAELDRARVVS
jgi:hypothetical protein